MHLLSLLDRVAGRPQGSPLHVHVAPMCREDPCGLLTLKGWKLPLCLKVIKTRHSTLNVTPVTGVVE